MVAVAVVSLAIATIVGVRTGEDLSDELNDDRLRATVESAAFDIAGEIRGLARTTDTLAVSLQAPAAIEQFGAAIDELESTVDQDDFDEQIDTLIEEYRKIYLEPLQDVGRETQLREIVDSSNASLYLQIEYAIDLGSLARPSALDDADDDSAWTAVHVLVHPTYRDVVNRLNLLDLYLVEADGTVVYTVSKRPEIGSNLETGPFSGSVLSDVFLRIQNDPDEGAAASDLSFYDAWPGVPVGVVGSPVFDDGRFVGALLVTYDGSIFTDLATGDRSYEAAGLPESGDVYVIGSDRTLRSDPRTFIEDRDAHLDASEAVGNLTADERERIEALGSTILIQRAADATGEASRSGDTDVADRRSLVGTDVLNIVVPVENELVDWSIVAEMDAGIAGNRLDDFQQLLIVGAAIFVVLLAFAAVAWANGIVRPIRYISDRISSSGLQDDDPIESTPQSPVEIQMLASQLEVMRADLLDQQQQIADARRERLDLLRSMLPPSVAERLASGGVQSLEQAPAATVVVVVVLGLADLVRADSAHSDRELVDHLHAEFDDLAAEHGLDRIKVVGDAYFAVVGHDRQYIDHAPRAIGFATDVLDAVHDLDTTVELDVAVGVHSGPVTTGTAGGAKLVYDVWGETVSRAHHLARESADGEIRLTEASRTLLPESIETEPVGDDDVVRILPTNAGTWSA